MNNIAFIGFAYDDDDDEDDDDDDNNDDDEDDNDDDDVIMMMMIKIKTAMKMMSLNYSRMTTIAMMVS